MSLSPTSEQQQIVAAYLRGEDLLVQAGAGTGKTSTLRLLAQADPKRQVVYTAFNRAIVLDTKTSMPGNVSCSTSHSLAFAAYGRNFAPRLRARRTTRREQAQTLAITEPFYYTVGGRKKVLQITYLAGHVAKALRIFCQTADERPTVRHFPRIDGLDEPFSYDNHDRLARALLPALNRAWVDAQDPQGRLPYEHGYYLKVAQLRGLMLNADVVMVDEAQDLAPVLLDIVMQQAERGAQVVFVGDSQQSIYGFTGAIDALDRVAGHPRAARAFTELWLTQSFRFGPAIAEVANQILADLSAKLRVVGFDRVTSNVITDTAETVDAPDAVLTRTNAVAIRELFRAQEAGVKAYLEGGSKTVREFAERSHELQTTGRTFGDLAQFDSWAEVEEYVDHDPQGEDLRMLVKLVNDYGAAKLAEMLDERNMSRREQAELVITTAHKSKGLQFPTVRLAGDFPAPEKMTAEDQRLLYVAVTRAQITLDVSAVAVLKPAIGSGVPAVEPEPETPVEEPAAAGWTYTPEQQAILDNPMVPGYVQPPFGPGTPYSRPEDVPLESPYARTVRAMYGGR